MLQKLWDTRYALIRKQNMWLEQKSRNSCHRVVFDHEVAFGSALRLTMHDVLWPYTRPLMSACLDALVTTSVLHWPEAWIWWDNNSRLVCSIVNTMGHKITELYLMGPRSWWGLNSQSFGILIGLWQETDGKVITYDVMIRIMNTNIVSAKMCHLLLYKGHTHSAVVPDKSQPYCLSKRTYSNLLWELAEWLCSFT